MALSIICGNPNSATKAFADLKADLDWEKAAQLIDQIKVDVLAQAVKDLKVSTDKFATQIPTLEDELKHLGSKVVAVKDLNVSTDKFATQIPTLEDEVKHLGNKVVDGLNEVRAWELCLGQTTRVNDDYKKQISQLTKKLESNSYGLFQNTPLSFHHLPTNPALAHRIRCRA
jgi:predicted  nucleic acid-binding Zn-ribbon protein